MALDTKKWLLEPFKEIHVRLLSQLLFSLFWYTPASHINNCCGPLPKVKWCHNPSPLDGCENLLNFVGGLRVERQKRNQFSICSENSCFALSLLPNTWWYPKRFRTVHWEKMRFFFQGSVFQMIILFAVFPHLNSHKVKETHYQSVKSP